jgi:hypothetical protein
VALGWVHVDQAECLLHFIANRDFLDLALLLQIWSALYAIPLLGTFREEVLEPRLRAVVKVWV